MFGWSVTSMKSEPGIREETFSNKLLQMISSRVELCVYIHTHTLILILVLFRLRHLPLTYDCDTLEDGDNMTVDMYD